jgi:hypothetical protein
MTFLQLKFYLSLGTQIDAIVESDGVSLDFFRMEIQSTIDNDETYVLRNVIDDAWVIVQARHVLAFSIIDLGENYMESFDIK